VSQDRQKRRRKKEMAHHPKETPPTWPDALTTASITPPIPSIPSLLISDPRLMISGIVSLSRKPKLRSHIHIPLLIYLGAVQTQLLA
jgi:hypothetical protein